VSPERVSALNPMTKNEKGLANGKRGIAAEQKKKERPREDEGHGEGTGSEKEKGKRPGSAKNFPS